ncbi:MAG: diguanylate cyclase (GGDEF)-like protein [Sulfurimonas sp.]|jgi:diguanylate cyclase (GGDEF)-like protein|uniref:diguanylate cyclase domain-containing protein n=1 Tax=Sulfurimonas sp. TaxID=2022749 RepID=UPI0039E61075
MQKVDNNYPIGTNDENELILKHRLLIRILLVIVILATGLVLIRLFYPNRLLMIIDISFILVSFIGIYYLNKSIQNTYLITKILIIIFFIIVSMMFTYDMLYLLGPSWFIVLIIFSFYQAGIREGLLTSIASFISIIVLAQLLNKPYTVEQYLYVLIPFLSAVSTIYLYEIKVTTKEKLLHFKNIAQKQLLEEKEDLLQQAHYDNLTKLPNRVLFQDRLNQAIIKTNRSNKDFAVLFIDLDRFKEINDSLGHSIGDTVLCEIASRLKNTLRQEDTVSRFGGDEFLCLVQQLESCESLANLAKKLVEATKAPLKVSNVTLKLTCSIGISIYKKDAKNEQDLLRHADTAMYLAKDLGKDNYQFYMPC